MFTLLKFWVLRNALVDFDLLNYFIRFVHLPPLRITILIVKLLLIDLVVVQMFVIANAVPSPDLPKNQVASARVALGVFRVLQELWPFFIY